LDGEWITTDLLEIKKQSIYRVHLVR
jgi:hypothetical protein